MRLFCGSGTVFSFMQALATGSRLLVRVTRARAMQSCENACALRSYMLRFGVRAARNKVWRTAFRAFVVSFRVVWVVRIEGVGTYDCASVARATRSPAMQRCEHGCAMRYYIHLAIVAPASALSLYNIVLNKQGQCHCILAPHSWQCQFVQSRPFIAVQVHPNAIHAPSAQGKPPLDAKDDTMAEPTLPLDEAAGDKVAEPALVLDEAKEARCYFESIR